MKRWEIILAVVITLLVIVAVPIVPVTSQEPFMETETYWEKEPYVEQVPLTDEEINAWYEKYGKPAGAFSIDDHTVEEILEAWSRRPELTKPLPEYNEVVKVRDVQKTREVVKLRDVSERVTILQYLVR